MNRSTPINNLPQNTFVNDQQRQIVLQAQQAINNMQLPQNTQLTQPNFEVPNEDDAAIQEVLNQIQASTGAPTDTMQSSVPTHLQQPQLPSIPALPPQPTQYITGNHNQADTNANQTMPYMGQYPPQPQQYIDGGLLSNRVPDQNSMMNSITAVANDVKLASFVFVLFILVQFVPVGNFLNKYIAIDKIPYYHIIVKALIAFVAVIVFKKFLS